MCFGNVLLLLFFALPPHPSIHPLPRFVFQSIPLSSWFSVCSPVTQHIKELLERNSKKKSKLRKKPKPYIEDHDGRVSQPSAPLSLVIVASDAFSFGSFPCPIAPLLTSASRFSPHLGLTPCVGPAFLLCSVAAAGHLFVSPAGADHGLTFKRSDRA